MPEDGWWVIGAESDDGIAIYLDQELLIASKKYHGPEQEGRAMELKAGYHDIAVRYANVLFDGRLVLLWSKFGQHMYPIPSRYLLLNKGTQR